MYNTVCKEKYFTDLWLCGGVFTVNQDRTYICRLIDIYGKVLSERQRDVVDLYYNEDLSLAEIKQKQYCNKFNRL